MRRVAARDLGKTYRRYHRPFDRVYEWVGGATHHVPFEAVRGEGFAVEPRE